MKIPLFFFIFLGVYLLLNGYLYIRGLQMLPQGYIRLIYSILFALLPLSFIAGMVLEDKFPIHITSFLQIVGGTWLIASMYLFAFVLILDLIRVVDHFCHIFPEFITQNYQTVKLITGVSALLLLTVVLIIGNIHYNRIKTIHLTLHTTKPIAYKPKIVVVSDLHFGYTITADGAKKFVDAINRKQADIVLICGDLFDRSLRPVIQARISDELRKIKAEKVYAVPGNHEYYGGIDKALKYMSESGITPLRDSIVEPYPGIVIIGRDDRTNTRRKSIKELMRGHEKDFTILMDHQPYKLNKAEEARVDVQFSGHTHDGQVWPINLITRSVYEKSHGYLKKGHTTFYVSSGLGIWGPKIRIGTQSEIIVADIQKDNL